MEKIYTYKNATILITKPDEKQMKSIKNATNEFMKKVIKGGYLDGNNNSSGDITK